LAAGQLTVFEDTHREAAIKQHALVTTGPRFRFYAGVPIMDENEELCGTFCIFDQKPRRFPAPDRATLMDLAALTQREIAGERMKSIHSSLTAKLGIARRESMMDPLTRLWNRRGASVLLKAAMDDGREQQSSIGIAILDLDNFKHINDTYGHQVGDEVLRKSALRLIQSVRSDDAVCRIGGDEFLLIMKDCDSDTARATTERIRRQLVEGPIPTRQGEITVSTSVGYAIRNGTEGESVDELIDRADQALLKSKSLGRDRVVEID
jgi:diguanylate cyclase (GGDEF)-like protein